MFGVLRDEPSLGLVVEESKPASRLEVQYTVELEATSYQLCGFLSFSGLALTSCPRNEVASNCL